MKNITDKKEETLSKFKVGDLENPVTLATIAERLENIDLYESGLSLWIEDFWRGRTSLNKINKYTKIK